MALASCGGSAGGGTSLAEGSGTLEVVSGFQAPVTRAATCDRAQATGQNGDEVAWSCSTVVPEGERAISFYGAFHPGAVGTFSWETENGPGHFALIVNVSTESGVAALHSDAGSTVVTSYGPVGTYVTGTFEGDLSTVYQARVVTAHVRGTFRVPRVQ